MGDQHRHPAAADTSTPAVVLKLDPNVMHHGGLGVIRSLGRIGVPVYGVHEGPLAPAAHSRYLQGRCFWQPGADDADRITDGLVQLADRIGRRAVLLPTDDAGAIFLAEHGAGLRSRFIFPDPPRDLPRQVAGKFSLHELCRELGIPSPAAAVPPTAAEAREFAARAGYPLIAKLTTPWASSLRSTSILTGPAELDDAFRASAREGAGLMLQEFIPGGRHRLVLPRLLRRHLRVPSGLHRGQGAVLPRARRPDQPRPLRAERRPPRPGHPAAEQARLPGPARPGPAPGPPRRPLQAARLQPAPGRPVPAVRHGRRPRPGRGRLPGPDRAAGGRTARPAPGRRFVVENYDPLGALGYWRRGELSPAGWLASLRGIERGGLVRPRRPAAVRAHVPADGLAPGRRRPQPPGRRRLPLLAGPGRAHQPQVTYHRGGTIMTDAVDVAIVGAGPYGLSVAAHLRGAGVSYRQFGLPMHLWRDAMPRGMFLKSQGFASNLSDPERSHTLEAFCRRPATPTPATGCRCRSTTSSATASGSPTSWCRGWRRSSSPTSSAPAAALT